MTGLELINIIKANDLEDKQIDEAEGGGIIFAYIERSSDDNSITRWTDRIIHIDDGTVSNIDFGSF